MFNQSPDFWCQVTCLMFTVYNQKLLWVFCKKFLSELNDKSWLKPNIVWFVANSVEENERRMKISLKPWAKWNWIEILHNGDDDNDLMLYMKQQLNVLCTMH